MSIIEITKEVYITLNGEKEKLIVCPRAAKEITANFGNYAEVFTRLVNFDHAAHVAIVAIGLNKKRAEVEDAVFWSGLPSLNDPLAEYVGFLLRAGRPIEKDNEKKDAPKGEA